jgi:Na+/H+-dicarboxylate symporter
MVLDIIPSNLFTPFSRGNTLQILFVAVVVGVTMLLLGKDTQSVADLSEQLGFIVNGIMSGISMMVPIFVFGSLLNIIASSDIGTLASGGKFFAGAVLGCMALMLMHTVLTCLRLRMTPIDLWKRTLSSFVIAITTASSSAVFADNIKTCTEKLGIPKRIVDFGVPFGQILYKPGVSVLFWFAAVSVAESEGTAVSIVWLVTAAAVCIILSAAAPPVPGGMTASFTILFAQLGLPVTNIAIILSLTSVLDFIVTGTNIFAGQCVLAVASKKMN